MKKKEENAGVPRLLSLGNVDLTFQAEFTEDELFDLNLEFDKLDSLSDWKFLAEKEDMWERFCLTSANPTLVTLLYLNRVGKKKTLVDYIPLGLPQFSDDEKWFENIIKSVTEKNGLMINETPLEDSGRYYIEIHFLCGEKVKTITFGSPAEKEPEGEGEEEKKEEQKEEQKEGEEAKSKEGEETKQKEGEEAQPKEGEEAKQDENQQGEENKQPESKPEGEEDKKEEDQQKEEEEKKKEEEEKKKEEEEKKKEEEEKKKKEEEEKKKKEEEKKDKTLEETLPGIHKQRKHKKEGEEEGEKKERHPLIPEFTNEDTILSKMNPKGTSYDILFLNFADIKGLSNFQMLDLVEFLLHLRTHSSSTLITISFPAIEEGGEEEMCLINSIFYLTDLFIWTKKNAITTFQGHYNTFTSDKEKKRIDNRNVYDYFIKGIATAAQPTPVQGHKIGLIIDDFKTFTVCEAKGSAGNTEKYDCRVYPKTNAHNIKNVEKYQEVIQDNIDYLMAIFIGGYLGGNASVAGKKGSAFGGGAVYISYLTGLEVTKRVVEILKNNLPLPTSNEFYVVKISKAKVDEEMKARAAGSQEGGFILDCVNKQKSAMKDYVPLYDYHLKGFFSSQIIRKDLKNNGFINTKGFVMYDPVYRAVMGPVCKQKKVKEEDKEFNDKLLYSIKDLKVSNNVSEKELDSKTIVLRANSPTDKKLPIMRDNEYAFAGVTTKKDNKKSTKGNVSKTQSQKKEEKPEKEEEKKEEEPKQEEAKQEEAPAEQA